MMAPGEMKAPLRKLRKAASKVLYDRDYAGLLLEQATHKKNVNETRLGEIFESLSGLLRMLRAWLSQEFPVDRKTLITAFGGLIYFINPFDIIPDFIVGGGLLDDVAVLTFVFTTIKNSINEFKEWEEEKISRPSSN